MSFQTRRRFFSAVLTLVLTFTFFACGNGTLFQKHNDDDESAGDLSLIDLATNLPSHLIFSTTNPQAYPAKSSIQQLDLETGEINTVLTGESSDPALFPNGSQAFLFNRSNDSQNFRKIGFQKGISLASSTDQHKFSGGIWGDPHDALALPNGRLLLAHFSEGKITVVNADNGGLIETVNADWDLPAKVELKPEALVSVEGNDGEVFIYVIHQAQSLSGGALLANGSQAVFVLRITDHNVEAVDLDAQKARIQGIPLKGSFPVPVRYRHRDKLLLVSMCSVFVSQSGEGAVPCVSAVEEVDPKTHKAEVVWDLAGHENLFMNGSVTPGPNKDIFFASVSQLSSTNETKYQVVRIDLGKKSVDTQYECVQGSYGFWGSFFDESRKTLLVGDIGTDSVGQFTLFKEGEGKKTIRLSGAPYSGTYLFAPRE